MRKFAGFLFLSLPLFSDGQDKKLNGVLPLTNDKVNYHDTINLDKINRQNIVAKILKWYATSYKELTEYSDTVSVFDQPDSSQISCRGYHNAKWKVPLFSGHRSEADNNLKVHVWHSIKLTAFDNGYYYEITNFKVERFKMKTLLNPFSSYIDIKLEDINTKTSEKKAEIFCIDVDKKIKKLISSINQFIKN